MNALQSSRVAVTTGALILLLAGAGQAASSSTVVLETGYDDSIRPVSGAATTPGVAAPRGAAGGTLVGPVAETARIQPGYAANSAASDLDAALLTPGTLVVSPGSENAARASAQGPAAIPDLSAPSMLFPALMALVAMAPLVGWLIVSRRGRSRPARHSHKALAEALAASVGAPESTAARTNPIGSERRSKGASRTSPSGTGTSRREDARRELDAALRRGPDGAAGDDTAELVRLRSEVLDGLREMKARVSEFTEALETGKAELQSELSRADRAIELLRMEREEFNHSVRLSPRPPLDGFEHSLFDDPRSAAPPITFRPPRIEAAKPAPTLDPAWMLLDDEGDGVWTPPAENSRADTGSTNRGVPTPTGGTAIRELARRSASRAAEGADPRERRRRIVDMARNGRTIDDISRELRVGRGEVTLALSRVR